MDRLTELPSLTVAWTQLKIIKVALFERQTQRRQYSVDLKGQQARPGNSMRYQHLYKRAGDVFLKSRNGRTYGHTDERTYGQTDIRTDIGTDGVRAGSLSLIMASDKSRKKVNDVVTEMNSFKTRPGYRHMFHPIGPGAKPSGRAVKLKILHKLAEFLQ